MVSLFSRRRLIDSVGISDDMSHLNMSTRWLLADLGDLVPLLLKDVPEKV